MRFSLSTIGSRGDVQPLMALALRLRELGHDVLACLPPDFRDWAEAFGVPVVPIGPPVRSTAASSSSLRRQLASPEGRRALAEASLAAQFDTIAQAARGSDVLVGCGALQVAAPSVAEMAGMPYVHVHYCPVTLPSTHHAPPRLPGWDVDETATPAELWEADARRWHDLWGGLLNARRAAAGLDPVEDVRSHVFTDHPWLAADPRLAPWPGPDKPGVLQTGVVQTGAWLLPDERPLSSELQAFLDEGEPPVYFGLGSMASPQHDAPGVMVEAARAVGRRAIVSRGWAGLEPGSGGEDWISAGETNHRALFARVAAVVHHGGAGTTTVAAQAGAPQVILPQRYDQPYWAHRVEALGIGVAHEIIPFTAPSLAGALSQVLEADVVSRAEDLSAGVRVDGARVAAQRLTSEAGR